MATTTLKSPAKKTQSTMASKNGTGTSMQSASAGKAQKTLNDLLEEGLKDMYSAEMQLVEALPKMAQAAYSEDLQDAFQNHLQQTKRHAERIEKVFNRLKIEKGEVEKCKAMEGLVEEANKIITEFDESPVRDSALIIAAQKVEHYEIASYGSLCELCDVLGYHNVAELLGRTLEEEEMTDRDLTDLAVEINDDAMEMSEQSGQETDDYQDENE